MKFACFIFYFKASQIYTIYFSICHLSAAITRTIRHLKPSTAAGNFLCGILTQALNKDTFKDSTVVCGEQQASVPNMDQTLKSIGLRLGDEVGHNSLLQNRRKLSLHHQAWVERTCEREVKSPFLKCSYISR